MSSVVVFASRAVVLEAEEPEWDYNSDPKKIIKWCKTAATMSGGQRSKALKLANYRSLRYIGDNDFICLPLDTHTEIEFRGTVHKKIALDKDYNHDPSPYLLHKLLGSDEWVCSCQWNTKMHMNCAHILALKIAFKRREFGRKENV